MSERPTTVLPHDERTYPTHGSTLTVREMLDYLQGLVAADPSLLTRHIHVSSGTALHDVYLVEWSEWFGVVLSTV
jgi:hypothetical protein